MPLKGGDAKLVFLSLGPSPQLYLTSVLKVRYASARSPSRTERGGRGQSARIRAADPCRHGACSVLSLSKTADDACLGFDGAWAYTSNPCQWSASLVSG